MARSLPTRADLIDYNDAVAGHDGTLCDIDGELFIKPCTSAEIAFYQTSVADHPAFAEVMPTFLGTLTLDEEHSGKSIEEVGASLIGKSLPDVVVPIKTGKRIKTNQAVVLENAAHGFVRPNIMDVKLGVQLWGDDAPQEKRTRFDKVTAETTHKDLGFRVAGMKVWQGHAAQGPEIDEEGYRVFDKNYGRFSLNKDNVHEAFEHFLFSSSAGIDEELGKVIASAFIADVSRIQAVLEAQESRMYSSSLLFVYEGDGPALRAAIEEASESPAKLQNVDSGYSGEEGEEDDDSDGEVVEGPKIYAVKVIDFAHANWTPGIGPDKSALLGVRSICKILENIADS